MHYTLCIEYKTIIVHCALVKKMVNYRLKKKYDEPMIQVAKKADMPTLDANYPYRKRTKKDAVLRWFIYDIVFRVLVYPLTWLIMGLKIRGRKKLKENKEILKNGGIVVGNHVAMWDALCMLRATKKKVYFPAWGDNLQGPFRHCIRIIGGMPIPPSMAAKKKLYADLTSVLKDGKWLFFFPETHLWWNYDAIRPFAKGAFTFAVDNNKPILPTVMNYRKAKGFRKLFRGGGPFTNVQILDPMLPDNSIESRDARIQELMIRVRTAMQEAAGFKRIIDQNQTHSKDEIVEYIRIKKTTNISKDLIMSDEELVALGSSAVQCGIDLTDDPLVISQDGTVGNVSSSTAEQIDSIEQNLDPQFTQDPIEQVAIEDEQAEPELINYEERVEQFFNDTDELETTDDTEYSTTDDNTETTIETVDLEEAVLNIE